MMNMDSWTPSHSFLPLRTHPHQPPSPIRNRIPTTLRNPHRSLQIPPSGLPTLQFPLIADGVWTYHLDNSLSLSCFFAPAPRSSRLSYILLDPSDPFSRGLICALSFHVSAITTNPELAFEDLVLLIPSDPLTNTNISSPRAQDAKLKPICYIRSPAETLVWQPLAFPLKAASFIASFRLKLAPDVLTRPFKKIYSLRVEL